MIRTNRYLMFIIFFTLCVIMLVQISYYHHAHLLSSEKVTCKEALVSLVGLPDLALVSETHYVRHRSLSDVFSYFNESPELLEYFPSTFVYHYAPSSNHSRIERVF